jgi:glycosyltransferase involved in cell wall biosynthesis
MQEILIISNYYPPEKGAAANRIEQLALNLYENNYKVTVVCPLANYPKGQLFTEYKGKFSVTENRDNITVKRLWIYPSISKNIFVRLLSVLSFSTSLFLYVFFAKTPKKVVVQSPPLLLSFISIFILNLKRKKIILNVSDLWPLAAIELKALKKDSFSHKVSLFMERYIYKKAAVIIGQSNEILSHINVILPSKKYYLYRNFPDHKVTKIEFETNENQPIRIFYAGLLGVAQGVLEMCQKIDLSNKNIELHIFGDGAEKNEIESLINKAENSKIYFYGMLERNELHLKLKEMDVAIVPLKTRIYGSVPSKIFEYGCLGFPILYFGGGEGGEIVKQNNLGWVAEVGNFEELNNEITIISKLSKIEILSIKQGVFDQSNKEFDLNYQMKQLLNKDVF